MSTRLGPIDMQCDAPPYCFVKTCGKLGFQSPLDVRWRRAHEKGDSFHPFWWLFGGGRKAKTTCTCGESLPALSHCFSTAESPKESHYLLGQCHRCRTMYWKICQCRAE